MNPSSSFLLLLGSFLVGFMASSEATDFHVGGKDGWILKPFESYKSWAGRNRFRVNDTLVFRYKKGEDSVLVVNENDFKECDVGSPIEKHEDGLSRVKIDRSGAFFFISGVADRCRQGQKFDVVVMGVRNPPPSPLPQPPSNPPSPSPKPPTPSPPPSNPPSPSPNTPPPSPKPSPNPQSPSPSNPQPQDSPVPAPEPSEHHHSSSSALRAPTVAIATVVMVLGFSFL